MNRHIALILLKILLTIPVAYALVYPFLHPSVSGGIFKEVQLLGGVGGIVFIGVFLSLVFLYCRDLYHTLQLVHPTARTATPRSVWLMFLLPYNFIEDFFIVTHVAHSLQREAQTNVALHPFNSFGMVSGLGWCAAQLVSLLPNVIGSMAGFIALLLWVIHWRLIRRVNAALRSANSK